MHDADSTGTAAYVLVPLVTAGVAVGLAAVDPTRVAPGLVRVLGLLPLAAGVGLVAWTALAFRRADETLSPVAEPTRLVTDGPLAHTRNPMYLGVVTTAAGVAVLAGSFAAGAYAGALAAVYHVVVVVNEEPALRAAHGEAYERYRRRVPRWLPLGRRQRSPPDDP